MHARNRTWPLGASAEERVRQRILPIEGGDGSTLTLDFTTGILDPRLTFSRTSDATFINSSGLVQYADANYFAQSETLSGSPWSTNGVSNTPVAVTNPNGGPDSRLIAVTASGGSKSILANASVAAGFRYTIRIWMRAGNSTSAAIGFLLGSFVTVTPSIVSGPGSVSGTTVCTVTGLTSAWTQVQMVLVTTTSAGTGGFYIYPNAVANSIGDSIHLWGAQMNIGTASNPYYTTTANPYYAPRFDHDPTTLAPRGLLIEGNATNYSNYSETFPTAPASGVGWNWSEVTANATLQTSPDGTTNAIAFNETTTAAALHRISHSVTAVAGALTCSVWVKVLDGSAPRRLFMNAVALMNVSALFDIDPAVQTGASGSAVNVAGTAANRAGTWVKYPNGWYRCSIVGTYNTATTMYLQLNRASSTTATDDYYTGSTSNGLMIWGFQLESGSGASSYIPTGASTGTRNQDQVQMTNLASLGFNTSAGTMTINGTYVKDANSAAFPRSIRFMGASVQSMAMITSGKTLFGNTPNTSGGSYFEASRTLASAGTFRFGWTLTTAVNPALASATVSLNGSSTSITPLGQGAIVNPTSLQFLYGAGAATDYPSMNISSLKYWPYATTAADLNARTSL